MGAHASVKLYDMNYLALLGSSSSRSLCKKWYVVANKKFEVHKMAAAEKLSAHSYSYLTLAATYSWRYSAELTTTTKYNS